MVAFVDYYDGYNNNVGFFCFCNIFVKIFQKKVDITEFICYNVTKYTNYRIFQWLVVSFRKLEWDKSMVVNTATQLRLGDVLIETGAITDTQLMQALELQKTSNPKRRLGEVLIESNVITEDRLLAALSRRLSVKYVSMNDAPVEQDAAAKIPKAIAVKHCLIPIAVTAEGSVLKININDPLNYYAIEDIKLITHMQIEMQICKKEEILRSINEVYAELDTQKAAQGANESAATTNFESTFISLDDDVDDTPVVTLINSTLLKAHSAGASDVHIEPFDKNTQIRIRVDGQIVDYLTLSDTLHSSMSARIKILAGMDIAEKRAPQDGHFRAKLEDLEINVRVSSMPTIYGEKLVLRFMSQSRALDNALTFGMESHNYEQIMKVLQVPHGLIYITGPTGSGKTTTLYMIMERLCERLVSIATIEDPVEKSLPRINQSQINPLAGLTFESGLRSILRQDPDVIMIGETRDAETAIISVRAALTGHLVVSSLHTNDAISAISRLLDMGIEDYLLADSLAGIVAQRLVKKVCPFCIEYYPPNENELKILGYPEIDTLVRGKGCHNCNNTGYKGRVAVHEVLAIDGRIRNMISKRATSEEIEEYVINEGKMKTLRESLLKLVLDKKTSVAELLKLTYYVE
jgi:type IV pilus assembly protein PilB